MKILSDARYQSDPSHRLLPPLCGPSPGPPDPFDKRAPQRAGHHQTHDRDDDPSQKLVGPGPEGPHRKTEARPEHEAWTRRMQPPKGQRTRPSVDRQTSQSFFGALSLIGKKITLYPIEGNRGTWQTIGALDLLQRETEAGKTAVVPDNARFHHAKMLAGLHQPGRLLERITPIHPPPYGPTTTRPSTSGTRPRATPPPSSTRPPKKPPAHPPHTPPNPPSTTTPNTSHPAKPETILLHDGHCFVTAMEGT